MTDVRLAESAWPADSTITMTALPLTLSVARVQSSTQVRGRSLRSRCVGGTRPSRARAAAHLGLCQVALGLSWCHRLAGSYRCARDGREQIRMGVGRRLGDTPLGDDDADEVVWCDIERWVEAPDPRRSRPHPGQGEHLVLVPFLDHDVLAPPDGQVDRGGRRGHDEGDPGSLTGERQTDRTDLVHCVTVRGDTVGPDDRDVDKTSQDGACGRAVSLYDVLDPVLQELPARQARTLQKRPCLVGIHETQATTLVQLVDDSVCGAPSAGR